MGPKAAYTAERLRAFGAKAVENAKKRFPDCDFACDYTGCEGAVSCRSQVSFRWSVGLGACGESFTVEMNCRHSERGVRFPDHWRTAIPCARLCGLALQSAGDLQSNVGVVSLSCTMLGVPKCAPVPLAGVTCVPGAVVQLQARNLARQDFLLAAHIDGDRLAMQYFLRGREVGECISKGIQSQVVLSFRVSG